VHGRNRDEVGRSVQNAFEAAAQRREALCLQQALKTARRLYREGARDAQLIIAAMQAGIAQIPSARVDYMAIVDRDTLHSVPRLDAPVLVALAIYIGKTRLIDNMILPDDSLSNLPE